MGERLNLARIRVNRRLDDRLTITRRKCARDVRPFVHRSVKPLQFTNDRMKRRPLVAAVRRVEKLALRTDRRELRRRRSGVDADVDRPFIRGKIAAPHLCAVMALLERRIVRRIGKEREVCLTRLLRRHVARLLHALFQAHHIDDLSLLRECRTERDKKIPIGCIDDVLGGKLQRLDEALSENGKEVQRSAEKRDIARNRTPLREIADRLIDDSLKNGKGDVCLLRTVVHQSLDICLGKDTAARSNRIDLLPLLRECIESCRIRRKKRRHVIDERTRAARTDAVHALFGRITEVRHLGVLAAKLNDGIRLGNQRPHS